MNYYEQLKKDYPNVEPCNDYSNWEKEAYLALEGKNYEKAEQLFIRVCLAGPEDFIGFEGLAYTSYIKGDYERAEWFINAAIELAKPLAETGDLDQKYYEELGQRGQTIKERGPLELLKITYTPGEAGNLFFTDRKSWYKSVISATVQRRYEMLMSVISKPLPTVVSRNIDEKDSDIEHYDSPYYLIDIIMDFSHELIRNKEMVKCRLLLENLRSNQPDLYKSNFTYFDKYLLQFALFEGNYEEVELCLENYKADPETGIDQLIAVLQLLLYYGLTEQAEALSKSVIHKIKDSVDIISGGELDFEAVIYLSALKRLYYQLQNGEKPTIEDLNSEYEQFGFSLEEDIFAWTLGLLKPGDDAAKIACLEKNEGGLHYREVLKMLSLLFAKHMQDKMIMDFVAASEISSFWVQLFIENASSDVFSFDEYLRLPLAEFENLVIAVGGFLSNQWPKSAALIWCAEHFYNFLLAEQAILQDCYDHAQAGISEMKKNFIDAYADNLWEYSFVCGWKRAEIVTDEDSSAETELFRKSYYEKAEVKKSKRSSRMGKSGIFDFGLPEIPPLLDSFGEKSKTYDEHMAEVKNRKRKKVKRKEAKKQKKKQRKKK